MEKRSKKVHCAVFLFLSAEVRHETLCGLGSGYTHQTQICERELSLHVLRDAHDEGETEVQSRMGGERSHVVAHVKDGGSWNCGALGREEGSAECWPGQGKIKIQEILSMEWYHIRK